MNLGLAEVLVSVYVVWLVTSIARSALRNLALRPARELSRLVSEVLQESRDPANSRREIEKLTRRISRRPEDANALMQRGLYYQTLHESDAAYRDYCRALEIRPEDPYVLLCRAQMELHRGEVECGIADLDRAIALASHDTNAILLRGSTYHRLGQIEKANEDLEMALNLPVWGSEALLRRAELRAGLRDDLAGAEQDATVRSIFSRIRSPRSASEPSAVNDAMPQTRLMQISARS